MRENETMTLALAQHLFQGVGMVTALAVAAVILAVVARSSAWRAGLSQNTQTVLNQVRAMTRTSRQFDPVATAREWLTAHSIDRRIRKAEAQLTALETVSEEGIGRSAPLVDARVRALLSLEQIAQDAVSVNQGHTHVRTMQILCAYIREAAPASGAIDFPLQEWAPLKDTATENEKAQHLAWRDARFSNKTNPNARDWAASLKTPREDIALALRILGRRGPPRRAVEARWIQGEMHEGHWVFDAPCPVLEYPEDGALPDAQKIKAFKTDLQNWTRTLSAYSGYRPDLRETNLQAADLTNLDLSGCQLDGARLEGAVLRSARLVGTSLQETRLDGADLRGARMEGANLSKATLEAANLKGAQSQGVIFNAARLEWANLTNARLEGAEFQNAKMEVASLYKARLAGSVFYRARMDGAVLGLAQMNGADLRRARMSWANLRDARLDGANLSWARLEGADLGGAYMFGVQLYRAQLQSANLRRAQLGQALLHKTQFADSTSLQSATFGHALLKQIVFADRSVTAAQIKNCFGDASVILPKGIARPEHWPQWEVPVFGKNGILDLWRQWRDDPDVYVSPPKPK